MNTAEKTDWAEQAKRLQVWEILHLGLKKFYNDELNVRVGLRGGVTLEATDTPGGAWAVYQIGGPIWGVGRSRGRAVLDALEWMDRPITRDDVESDFVGAIRIAPTTERLYQQVIEHGDTLYRDDLPDGRIDLMDD